MALNPLPMMRAARLLLLLLTLLPLTAAERAAFGVVALDVEPQIHRHLPLREGAVVDGVWPGSKKGCTPPLRGWSHNGCT